MTEKEVFCKRIVFLRQPHNNMQVMYGLVTEDGDFYEIRTRNGTYLLKKEHIESILPSTIKFDGGLQQ